LKKEKCSGKKPLSDDGGCENWIRRKTKRSKQRSRETPGLERKLPEKKNKNQIHFPSRNTDKAGGGGSGRTKGNDPVQVGPEN